MKLFWKLYSLLFLLIVAGNAAQVLDKNSTFGVYYQTTLIFNHWYIIPYFLNIFNTLASCVVVLFIFGYAFDLSILSRAPVWFFYLWIFSNTVGHAYEFQMVHAAFYQSTWAGLVATASLFVPILPTYLALWRMSTPTK